LRRRLRREAGERRDVVPATGSQAEPCERGDHEHSSPAKNGGAISIVVVVSRLPAHQKVPRGAFYHRDRRIAPTKLPDTVPLYRLFRGAAPDHFYTSSDDERAYAIALGYADEWISGYVWQEP